MLYAYTIRSQISIKIEAPFFHLGENRTLIASKEACGSPTALYFFWRSYFQLQDVNSSLCMASFEIPTEANPRQVTNYVSPSMLSRKR